MVEAYQANVIYPNKAVSKFGKLYKGHLLESETYIGGHVESLHAGVFRSDIPMNFDLDVFTLRKLIAELDETLQFFLEVECAPHIVQLSCVVVLIPSVYACG